VWQTGSVSFDCVEEAGCLQREDQRAFKREKKARGNVWEGKRSWTDSTEKKMRTGAADPPARSLNGLANTEKGFRENSRKKEFRK